MKKIYYQVLLILLKQFKSLTLAFAFLMVCQSIAIAQFQIGKGSVVSTSAAISANGKAYAIASSRSYIGIIDQVTGAVSSFGSKGAADGQFNSIYDLTVASDGRIYVCDNQNSRIQVFDAFGNFITKFNNVLPTGITIGNNGNIYVTGGDKVSVYNSTHTLLYEFGSSGSSDGQFNSPQGVAVDQNNQIYVVDWGNNRVQVFNGNNNGSLVRKFSYTTQFGTAATGIAVDNLTGEIYVSGVSPSPKNGSIEKYDNDGNFLSSSFTNTSYAYRLHIDNNSHHLWLVYDGGFPLEYALDGTLLNTYGMGDPNDHPNYLIKPKGITTDGAGNIYVVATDYNNSSWSIKKFDSNGNYLNRFFSGFYCMGLATDGTYFYNGGNGAIKKYNNLGALAASATGPVGNGFLACNGTGAPGYVYICDKNNKRINVYNTSDLTLHHTFGSAGSGNGQFNSPWGIAVDNNGNKYVADNSTNRSIQKFDVNDTWLWTVNITSPDYPAGGIAVDNTNGYLYVALSSSKINKYDLNGNLLATLSSEGMNLGQINGPQYMHFDNGKLMISDNDRLEVLIGGAKMGLALGGGNDIPNGGTSTMGNATTSLTSTFSVISQGLQPLSLTGSPKVQISGVNASDFTVDASSLASTFSGTSSFNITFTPGGTGTRTATVSIASNDPTASPYTFTIEGTNKLPQTISNFSAISNHVYGDASFAVTGVTASSSLPVSFSSSNTSIATVSGNMVTIVGTGTANIIASQTGDATYFSAPNVLQTLTVTKKPLVINGVTASKTYDGTISISLVGTPTLSGVISGDDVSLNAGSTLATLDSKNVGSGKTVTINGYTLGGTHAGNYSLPTSLTGVVTTAELTISGITIADKVYNGTSTATLSGTAALNGKIAGDNVTVNTGLAAGQFGDGKVGTAKSVSVTGYTITGTDAGNYSLSQPALIGNITPATLTISGVTANKVYDRTTTATLSGTPALSGVVTGDVVTVNGTAAAGQFTNATVGDAKTVTVTGYTITGVDAGNYTFSQPTLTGDITAAPLTISGVAASNKVYDGTTSTTLTGTAALSGVITGDMVTLGGTAAGQFADSNAGDAKTVTVTGFTISGTDAGNYSLSQPALTASITKANQTIAFATVAAKTQGDAAFSLSSSSSSTLAVTYTIVSGPATVSGSTVTLSGAGSVTVKASQTGNGNFNAAADVSQTFCVNPSKPSITVSVTNSEHPVLTSSASAGNQWYLNGTAISNSTGATLTISQAGNYTVKVTVDGCASAASDAKAMIVTGVESNDPRMRVVCYPNPAVNEVTIHYNNASEVQDLKIIDLSGRVMQQGGQELINVPLSVGHYGNGTYLVRIKTGNQLLTGKFLKN